MSARTGRRHRVLIVGGGTAGITVAARLRRAGVGDVGLVEPSETHWYQPLWTLVGGGVVPKEHTARPMRDLIPSGVAWLRDRALSIDPDARVVETEGSGAVGYDFLVAAPGLQLDWDRIPGLHDALATPRVSSIYDVERAERTWEWLREFPGGRAVFTCPPMPIKCAGAPQKILYLACDHLRRRGRLAGSQMIYGCAPATIFGVPEYAEVLMQVVERYGIDARFGHELVAVDAARREAVFSVAVGDERKEVRIAYDALHVVPPQSAPGWIQRGPLARREPPMAGWIDVDKHTLQHVRYPDVFALGDATTTPNSKTGAAVRAQAPVLVANLRAAMAGRPLEARYGGYGACPLVTGYGRLLLAEFDYSMKPTPTLPLIDTMRERRLTWLLKRYGLPWMYWHLMLRGLA
jgi:sulfide:quinone oxidoreductase